MDGLPFLDYLSQNRDEIMLRTQEHALLALYTLVMASVLGLLIAITVFRSKALSALTISAASVGFTVPSVALFGFLVSFAGQGLLSVFPVLVLYALLPILRNSIVGLQAADPFVIDAARGMGVGGFRMLWQIRLPIAWPVILAGLRVSAQLTVGIAAIAAFVDDIGLGEYAFSALDNLGSVNTRNQAMVCVLFVAVVALAFDAVFVIVRRFTTPRGTHA